jgi:hypothetical protein
MFQLLVLDASKLLADFVDLLRLVTWSYFYFYGCYLMGKLYNIGLSPISDSLRGFA